MSKPIAVLISDIHYNINTLELADAALRQALKKAEDLHVPLIIAGDLLDNKAIIRAECANALLTTLEQPQTPVYILVGNHDMINVKGKDNALNFLEHHDEDVFIKVIDKLDITYQNVHLLPYYDNPAEFKETLYTIPKGSIVVCHQGVMGANMGTYAIDNSSVDPAELKDYRIISGHYHKHQTVGTVTYIGNPYTLSFAEASDGPKGFQVLNDDGTLTFVPTNLRKHVIINITLEDKHFFIDTYDYTNINENDLIWVKLKGNKTELDLILKDKIAAELQIKHTNFKLDKIYTDSSPVKLDPTKLTGEQMFDQLIDNTNETDDKKAYTKKLWREIL